jgi:hypothetical protein
VKESTEKCNVLIDQWRNTDENDYKTRATICGELSKLFESRAAWQRKHKRSYAWATTRGIVQKMTGKGLRYGKPVEFVSTSRLTRIARSRDELHDFCCLKRLGYAQEQYAGAVFLQQVNAGIEIETALQNAKDSLALAA